MSGCILIATMIPITTLLAQRQQRVPMTARNLILVLVVVFSLSTVIRTSRWMARNGWRQPILEPPQSVLQRVARHWANFTGTKRRIGLIISWNFVMNTSVRKTQKKYAKNSSKPNKQSNQHVSAGAYAARCEVLAPHFCLIYFK